MQVCLLVAQQQEGYLQQQYVVIIILWEWLCCVSTVAIEIGCELATCSDRCYT